jgi:hypothetical protein
MRVQFTREICPALGVERHRKTFASRVKLARQLAEIRKPQEPVDRNYFDVCHEQSW